VSELCPSDKQSRLNSPVVAMLAPPDDASAGVLTYDDGEHDPEPADHDKPPCQEGWMDPCIGTSRATQRIRHLPSTFALSLTWRSASWTKRST
jgi:hypothetical protein